MRNLIILIALTFSFLACTKIISATHPHKNLLDSSKKHYYFSKGTYWIYRDSISGRTDSCYVYSSILDTLNSNGLLMEHLKIKMRQYPIDGSKTDSIFYQFEIYPGDRFYFTGDTSYLSYSNDFSFFSTMLPLSKDSVFQSEYDYSNVTVRNNIKLNLNGNIFTDIFEITTGKPSTTNGRTIFFNEQIGLVKMRIHIEDRYYTKEDKVWELQRWNIIKS